MTQDSLFDLRGTSLGGEPRTPANLPDITRRKHGGNPQSESANSRLHPHKANLREKVRQYVQSCCGRGATLSETCAHLGKLPHQLSPRFSELSTKGEIRETGKTRKNERGNLEAVYVL